MKIMRPFTFAISDPNHKRWTEEIYRMFQRNVSFGLAVDSQDQNIQGKMVEVSDTGLANTQFVVTHNLGYVPKFFDIKYRNIACSVYDSGTAWTKTQVFLKCDQPNAHLRIFIH